MTSAAIPAPDVESIRALLRQVMDPEAGINIVDLGLIYRIDAAPNAVHIVMTMTTPACPLGDMIMDEIDAALGAALPDQTRITTELVWDPPWRREMMSAEAREHFGW